MCKVIYILLVLILVCTIKHINIKSKKWYVLYYLYYSVKAIN